MSGPVKAMEHSAKIKKNSVLRCVMHYPFFLTDAERKHCYTQIIHGSVA